VIVWHRMFFRDGIAPCRWLPTVAFCAPEARSAACARMPAWPPPACARN